MYKIKNSYIDSMIKQKTTSKEIDFILYIATFQDEHGTVNSVYYREVCDSAGLSIQTFYDVLDSLCRKGLITYSKLNAADITVTLTNNDFSDGDYSCGYLKVASKKFQDKKFREMKAGSKLLYLYMQRFVNGRHMLVSGFYSRFCELFGVVTKSIQRYLLELKNAALLFVSRKRNKSYHYEINLRNTNALDRRESDIMAESTAFDENICSMIQCNFRKYLPNDERKRGVLLHNLSSLSGQKRFRGMDPISFLLDTISLSVRLQKKEGRHRVIINAPYVNKLMSERIQVASI